MDNAEIADRLDAFAAVLELATRIRTRSAPTGGAARRSATARCRSPSSSPPVTVASFEESGPGSKPACASSERRTDRGARRARRDLVPDLVRLGRYLGLSAKRELTSPARSRSAPRASYGSAAAGRLREVPGIGPKTEAQIVSALARETDARSPRGAWLNRAGELLGGIRVPSMPSPPEMCGGGVTPATSSRSFVRRHAPCACPPCSRAAADRRRAQQGDRHAVGVNIGPGPGAANVPYPNCSGTALMLETRSP